MDLSIVIVNYNSNDDLYSCLNSVNKFTEGLNLEIIVIDNNSESKPRLDSETLILNNRNEGFAKAVNQGILKSKGDYILLLNPDTVLLGNSFKKMFDFMEDHEKTGVVGCKLLNKDMSIQPSCHNFPNGMHIFMESSQLDILCPKNSFSIAVLGNLNRFFPKTLANYSSSKKIKNVDNVMGSCYMIRKSALDKTGLLDEKFFLYHEEMELSYRMHLKGFEVTYFPDASVLHKGKRSANKYKHRVYLEKVKSMKYFLDKYDKKGKNFLALGVIINLLFCIPQFFRKDFKKLINSRIKALKSL